MKQLVTLLSLIIVVGFFSCQDSDRDEDTSTNSSTDYATGQSIVYDVFKMVHQAANSSKGIAAVNLLDSNSLFGCDTLIVDTISNPMNIIIRFDTSSCINNGINRSGEITATFSSKYDLLGCNVTINFNGYKQGNFSIPSGTITYTNNGLINSQPNYSYNVNKFKIENNQTRNIIWSGNQTLSISSGETTASFSDDTYTISGIANGSTFQGNSFSATIVSDLTLLGNCNWISSGTANVSPENKTVRLLTFGSGCDNKANTSIFDINYEIIMP